MLKVGDAAPKFEFTSQTGKKQNFPEDFKGKWVGVHFLRYVGCPICLEKLDDLIKNQQKYAASGVEILAIVQSTEKRVKTYAEKKGVKFHLVPDRERKLYELYQVDVGGIGAFFAPQVTIATIRTTLKGNFHGAFEGAELQKPASFIIDPQGKLAFAYYGKNIADFISEDKFGEALAGLNVKGK
jgi:thioredoxin-dependent peroxiredoxin